MKGSSAAKLLITAIIALFGLGFASLQFQIGHITIIIGDKNEVENGNQTQTVVQPVKPVAAEAKTTTVPVAEVTTVPEKTQPVGQSHHASVPRQSYQAEEEESEDDCVCTCPDDEEEGDEGEEEEEPTLQAAA